MGLKSLGYSPTTYEDVYSGTGPFANILYWYGPRGVFAGGSAASPYVTTMDYVTIATTGNATTFGALAGGRQYSCSGSDSARGVFPGGDGYCGG